MKKYSIRLVTRMRVYSGQSIQGCCGKITTEYFIFSANSKSGLQPESIVVGSECGRQFLALLGEKLPPLFNATGKQKDNADVSSHSVECAKTPEEGDNTPTQMFELDRYIQDLTPLNLEYYNALHLIISSWGGVCNGVLSKMLCYLKENPEKDTNVYWLKRLNGIIKSDRRNRGLVAMAAGLRAKNPGIMYFEFQLLEETLAAEGIKLKL